MNHPDEEQLWRHVLADEALERVRSTSLAAMLVAARRRRRRRALVPAAAALACLGGALWMSVPRLAHAPVPAPELPSAPPRVVTITDEQLLALFPDRAIALVGGPGGQTLMFLDVAPAESPRTSIR